MRATAAAAGRVAAVPVAGHRSNPAAGSTLPRRPRYPLAACLRQRAMHG